MDKKNLIESGRSTIGIELGSTRIKAVLIDESGTILGKGGFDWENHLIDGIWTYEQDEIWTGLQECYKNLNESIEKTYGITISKVSAIGISGMMHGYMPFDKNGRLLAPFRTWRNNITEAAAEKLTKLFQFNIPQRWSIAHLYQSIMDQESHVEQLDYLTTLSGYVHWKLTGKKVIGIGEASGMFPIDTAERTFDHRMIQKFNSLISDKGYPWKLEDVLPKVLAAGQPAGKLTEEGALLLDPTGSLQPGAVMCPPEGDAGTGMVATNCVSERTGNISAGTSAFAMIVLEKELSKVYKELDMVVTPEGKPVAMAHSNNCSSDINAWINLFGECLKEFGVSYEPDTLYKKLFTKALDGDDNCGNLLAYCFYSGEHNVGISEGCPLFLHPENADFNLANFIRVHLYTAFGAMKIGMDILMKQEKVSIDRIVGHGGIFKTKGVAQNILAAALNVPVAVLETAGEGGAWGIALLAAYLKDAGSIRSLEEFLKISVFKDFKMDVVMPEKKAVNGYENFIERFKHGLPIEYKAIQYIKKLY